MARKVTKGVAEFNASFKYSSAVPIDNRFTVAAKADLTASETWVENGVSAAYAGLLVYVEGESSSYVLTSADYSSLNNWKKIATADNVVGGTSYKGLQDSLTQLGNVSLPSAGDMYYVDHAAYESATGWDSEDGAFYIYNGSTWDKINREDVSHATTADSASRLTNDITINGMSVNGGSTRTNYVECNTSADVQAKIVTLTNMDTDNPGTVLRVKFNYGNDVASPTLNGFALKRGSEVFDKWESGTVVTFTLSLEGSSTKVWQAHETEGQDVILRNISKVDLSTFDFINTNDGSLPSDNSTDEPIASSSADAESVNELFSKIFGLAQNPDGKLHFLKFNGKRYKFDIDAYRSTNGVDAVVFSFIVSGFQTHGEEQMANIVTVTWSRAVENTEYVFEYKYNVSSLIGGTVDTSAFATKSELSGLAGRVTAVESSVNWYSLDEDE